MPLLSKESANEIIGKQSCYDKKYNDGAFKLGKYTFSNPLAIIGISFIIFNVKGTCFSSIFKGNWSLNVFM